MKKIKTITILAAILLANLCYSQKDSVYISKLVDDMSDKISYFPSRKMMCSDDDSKAAFAVSVFMKHQDDQLRVVNLSIRSTGIGSCLEKDVLIIMFEDDSKINLVSWNDFNCKGNSWFNVSGSDIEKLSTLKIKKVKFQNGRSFESLTKEITDDKDYFTQLFWAIKNNKIKEEKAK